MKKKKYKENYIAKTFLKNMFVFKFQTYFLMMERVSAIYEAREAAL